MEPRCLSPETRPRLARRAAAEQELSQRRPSAAELPLLVLVQFSFLSSS